MKFYYGGQAVIEGVMMRGRSSAAVAIRKPDGDIHIYEEALDPRLYQSKLWRLPFLRGMLLLWEMLVLGTRLMTVSANIASGAVDPDAPASSPEMAPAGEPAEASNKLEEERPAQLGGATLVFTLLISLGLGVAIFFVGPLLLTSLFHQQLGEGWLNVIVEGVIRLALLVGYLYLIGRIPDIQRVFGYHGAEHKAINAMESGDPLGVEHVRRASRVHTRCGTGFLLLVMVVSIFVFALVGSPTLPLKILSRIVLVPIVAGIAYELMRLGAANYRYRVVRWLLAPGLALQGLTTREPDDSMMECAIAALKRVMLRDRVLELENEQEHLPQLAVSPGD
ncbi:DUF1385 domain-containing protein [Ktedonosporobacter rubrisoli]|uniref:DUF1385 domain-containing protein n=1 Tax=Ktedonosporobacter rubrisoli TaxID=2509675 RepID=A0A4P6K1G5_KTERU|nr:DUF1385 domain-containing protein [Ktedonosporobacter rubrisoli]QBD81510.1 DUF1385 domain-containing protein [Ktedonosporobacter rubrisoli]